MIIYSSIGIIMAVVLIIGIGWHYEKHSNNWNSWGDEEYIVALIGAIVASMIWPAALIIAAVSGIVAGLFFLPRGIAALKERRDN